jgi:hypothetical protein
MFFVRLSVQLKPGNDIQQAIDDLAKEPLGPDGFRGAILLRRGVYTVPHPGLQVLHSGIVLRGEGQGNNGTKLIFTSTFGDSNTITLGQFKGKFTNVEPGWVTYEVTDNFVPVGTRTIHITNTSTISPGDRIRIQLLPNDDWLLHSTYCHLHEEAYLLLLICTRRDEWHSHPPLLC